MKLRKFVTLIVITSLCFFAPAVIPAKATPGPTGCGVFIIWVPSDTAYASPPAPVPCPTKTPWVAYGIFASAFSVILNAIIVSQTQCRELTQQEAFASAFLPFIGFAWNKHHNHCHPH